jgi:hypothetical protein
VIISIISWFRSVFSACVLEVGLSQVLCRPPNFSLQTSGMGNTANSSSDVHICRIRPKEIRSYEATTYMFN